MTGFLIGFITLFRPLYLALGIDFNQVRAIVRVKLLMDDRRNTTAFQQVKNGNQSRFIFVLVLHVGFSFFLAIAIFSLPSILVSMTFYHSFLIVMISMTLISNFSSVLLDTSDNSIILPRPVTGRTLSAARITHISLYLGQITIALMTAPFLATFFKFGWVVAISFLATTSLSVLFAVTFANGIYLLLMQWTSEEKLKSVINYFQIFITVIMMGGYQLLPRLMASSLTEVTDFSMSWWANLIPPFWMSGALEMLYSGPVDPVHILACALAFIIPIGGFYAMNKYLAPDFINKLTDLGTSNIVASADERKKSNDRFSLGAWVCSPGLELAAYSIVSAILSRDRKLKLKIYPSIGSLFVLAFIVLLRGKSSLKIMFNGLPRTSVHIFLLYGGFFVVQTVMAEICYSDEFKAAWIYTSAPIQRPGEILSGAWKAVVVKFFLPIFIVTSTFILFIWREDALDDIYFAIGSNAFLFLAAANVSNKRFPFSMEPNTRNQAGNFARMMIMFILLAAVGGVHFILSKVDYALWAGGPLLFGLAYFLLREFQATKWNQIEF